MKDASKEALITLRVSRDVESRWNKLSRGQDKTLSEWIVDAVNGHVMHDPVLSDVSFFYAEGEARYDERINTAYDAITALSGVAIDGLVLCGRVYQIHQIISRISRPEWRHPSGLEKEKKLYEELLPLCVYIQTHYQLGRYLAVTWFDDDQTRDAELTHSGSLAQLEGLPPDCFIEVTSAMPMGQSLANGLLQEEKYVFGIDGITRCEPGSSSDSQAPSPLLSTEKIIQLAQLVFEAIGKKEKKNYPVNTVLIVRCNFERSLCKEEWKNLMRIVKEGLTASRFIEIFIYIDSGRHRSSLQFAHNRVANAP